MSEIVRDCVGEELGVEVLVGSLVGEPPVLEKDMVTSRDEDVVCDRAAVVVSLLD